MGCSNSKPVDTSVKSPSQDTSDIFYAENQRNMALLRNCVNNNYEGIEMAIKNQSNLAMPYRNAPLIFSAVLALINDYNHERYRKNWNLITSYFSMTVSPIHKIKVFMTHFRKNPNTPRTNGFLVFHLEKLDLDIIQDTHRYHKTVCLGTLIDGNIKDLLIFILNHLHRHLKDMTATQDYQEYRGSYMEKLEQAIESNAKYSIKHTNEIEKYWQGSAQTNYAYAVPPPTAPGVPVEPSAPVYQS